MRSVEASLSTHSAHPPSSIATTNNNNNNSSSSSTTLDTPATFGSADNLLALSPNMANAMGDMPISASTTSTASTAIEVNGLTTEVRLEPIADTVNTASTATAGVGAGVGVGQGENTVAIPSVVNSSIASSSPLMESTPLSPETMTTSASTTPLARSPATLPAVDPLRISPSPPNTNTNTNTNPLVTSNVNMVGVVETPLPGEEVPSGGRDIKAMDGNKRRKNRRLYAEYTMVYNL